MVVKAVTVVVAVAVVGTAPGGGGGGGGGGGRGRVQKLPCERPAEIELALFEKTAAPPSTHVAFECVGR